MPLQYATAAAHGAGRWANRWLPSLTLYCSTHQSRLSGSSYAFPPHDVSTVSLAKRDLTDVGISGAGALHTGLGFFGLLNAASASLPCGWGGHEPRGSEIERFMFCIRYGRGW